MADQDKTFEDLAAAPLDKLQILLYGEPKTGKTVLAHSFPRPRTLDCDNGLRSVIAAVRRGIIPMPKDWKYRTIIEEDYEAHGILKSARAIDEVTDTLDEWIKESDQWDTLIVDSLTSFNVFCINRALEINAALGQSQSKALSKKHRVTIMRKQDWGGAMSLFTDFITWVRSLDKNLILIAHVHETTDEEGRVRKTRPLLIGQLRQRLLKEFDEVWYSNKSGTADNTRFYTQTQGDGLIVAGSRLDFTGKDEFLTYDKILNRVKNPDYKVDRKAEREARKRVAS